jgi:hypothetical protein
MGNPSLQIGVGSSRLRLEPLRRTHPKSRSRIFGNFLETAVHVETGAFRGTFKTRLSVADFLGFRAELEHVYHNLQGTARFVSAQKCVRVQARGDGVGHFLARCQVVDATWPDESFVCWVVRFDQTWIPDMVQALNEIELEFPFIN